MFKSGLEKKYLHVTSGKVYEKLYPFAKEGKKYVSSYECPYVNFALTKMSKEATLKEIIDIEKKLNNKKEKETIKSEEL